MEQVTDLWVMLRQQIDAFFGHLSGVSPDHLRLIAALACLVAFILLISLLRAGQVYRRMRDERDDLKQQLAALQSAYDSEIRWRKASEASNVPKAIN